VCILRLQLWARKILKVELRDIYSWWKWEQEQVSVNTSRHLAGSVHSPESSSPKVYACRITRTGLGTAFVEMLDQSSISGSSHSPIAGQNKPAVNWGQNPTTSADSTAEFGMSTLGKECDQGQVLTHPSYVYVAPLCLPDHKLWSVAAMITYSGFGDYVMVVQKLMWTGGLSRLQTVKQLVLYLHRTFNSFG
ncbi:hypothetical protein Hamer_G027417, partial [Homarus americanus]